MDGDGLLDRSPSQQVSIISQSDNSAIHKVFCEHLEPLASLPDLWVQALGPDTLHGITQSFIGRLSSSEGTANFVQLMKILGRLSA